MIEWIVFERATSRFLVLEGPFQYPRWIAHGADATRMSAPRARQCAAAFGGEATPLPPMHYARLAPPADAVSDRGNASQAPDEFVWPRFIVADPTAMEPGE